MTEIHMPLSWNLLQAGWFIMVKGAAVLVELLQYWVIGMKLVNSPEGVSTPDIGVAHESKLLQLEEARLIKRNHPGKWQLVVSDAEAPHHQRSFVMSTYEFGCIDCGHKFDLFATISHKERGLDVKCPECSSKITCSCSTA